jgi:hypothetical protein
VGYIDTHSTQMQYSLPCRPHATDEAAVLKRRKPVPAPAVLKRRHPAV